MIVTVKDLIKELLDFNPDAIVQIGDNFENRVALGWSGSEGCDKTNCKYLCLDIDGQDTENEVPHKEPEDSKEPEYFSEAPSMKYSNDTIVITDPCYLKHSTPDMRRGTIYGDWSCMVYPGKMGENSGPEVWNERYMNFWNDYNFGGKTDEEKKQLLTDFQEMKKGWLENNALGEFSADGGEVAVFTWLKLSNDDRKWVLDHPSCAAVINNVTGEVRFRIVTDEKGNQSCHVVCEGTTEFFTEQSGF